MRTAPRLRSQLSQQALGSWPRLRGGPQPPRPADGTPRLPARRFFSFASRVRSSLLHGWGRLRAVIWAFSWEGAWVWLLWVPPFLRSIHSCAFNSLGPALAKGLPMDDAAPAGTRCMAWSVAPSVGGSRSALCRTVSGPGPGTRGSACDRRGQVFYDCSSNRTFAYDARFQNGWPMNHTYANDPLNRLTAMMRNTRANLPDPGDAMVEGIFGACVESHESRHVEDFQVGGQPPCKYKPNGTPAATGGGPGNGRGPEGCRPVGMSRILARVRLPECASKRL